MKSLAGPKSMVFDPWPAATAPQSEPLWIAAAGATGAARHGAGCALEADVVCHVHIAVGVVEIEPVVLVREQLGAKAHDPRMIDVIERTEVGRGVAREVLVVVGVVVPLQVVEGAGDRRPGLWPVEGMHPVVLHLPESHRGEGVVVVHDLDAAVEVPVACGAQGGGEDSAVFVDGHLAGGRVVGRNRNIVRAMFPGPRRSGDPDSAR